MACVQAAEDAGNIHVPERALFIRSIVGELERIHSHLLWLGLAGHFIGFNTIWMWAWRFREDVLNILELITGNRNHYGMMKPGGVRRDINKTDIPAVKGLLDGLQDPIKMFRDAVIQDPLIHARTKGVGILTKEMAISCGISGPVARASGVKWDLRKADPYSIYDRFEFDIPTGGAGDCYDRYRVRVEEMRQSLRIIKQAMKQIPSGPVRADVPHLIRPPAGEAYAHIEAPKGELGFYLVSDNSIAPYRCHVRPTSLINLTALREMIIGWKVQDLIITFGSIDITMGEVDR